MSVTATRVGSVTITRGRRRAAACHRCGTTRTINPHRPGTGLCADCHLVEPHWPNLKDTPCPAS